MKNFKHTAGYKPIQNESKSSLGSSLGCSEKGDKCGEGSLYNLVERTSYGWKGLWSESEGGGVHSVRAQKRQIIKGGKEVKKKKEICV